MSITPRCPHCGEPDYGTERHKCPKRKKTDAKPVEISVRLTPEMVVALDRARGDLTRREKVKQIVEAAIKREAK